MVRATGIEPATSAHLASPANVVFLNGMKTRESSWLAAAGTTHEMGRAMLQALEESDLSPAAFCHEHRIPAHRMSYWRQRLQEIETSKPQSEAVRGEEVDAGICNASDSGDARAESSRG